MFTLYNYEEFKRRILEKLREKYGEEAVCVITVTRNNNLKVDGICFGKGTKVASPIMYLDHKKEYYSDYDMERLMEDAENYVKSIKIYSDKAVEDSRNWEKMKDKIFPRVINYEMNKEKLEYTPHVRFLDMAVVFFFQSNELFPELGEGTIMVHDGIREAWEVSVEKLMKYSMKNLKELECGCKRLEEFLDMYGIPVTEDMEIPLYMVTVYDGCYGATAMLNRVFMEEACEKMESQKLWIIPSSVHEVLLLPYERSVDAHGLHRVCNDVNKTLNLEDILSDSIYLYDNETKQINFAKGGQ